MGCSANEISDRVADQVERGAPRLEAMRRARPARLRVRCGGRCVRARCWGRFFWLVRLRRSDRRDLLIDKEGRGVDALVLWFVILRDGAGRGADVRSDVGAAGVEGVGVDAAAVAIRGGGVERAGGVDEAGGVVGVVAAAGVVGVGVGVDDVGVVVDDGDIVGVAVVVDCAGIDVGIAFAFAVGVAVAAFDDGVVVGGADAVDDAGAVV